MTAMHSGVRWVVAAGCAALSTTALVGCSNHQTSDEAAAAYIEAFNADDVEGMLAQATDVVEGQKQALTAAMDHCSLDPSTVHAEETVSTSFSRVTATGACGGEPASVAFRIFNADEVSQDTAGDRSGWVILGPTLPGGKDANETIPSDPPSIADWPRVS